jgi:FMN-dependent NADH-azoreductase
MSRTLLKITTSINGEGSISNGHCAAFLGAFKEKNPDATIVERDLQVNPPPHLDAEVVYGGYVPEDQRTESQAAKVNARLVLVNEALAATDIVIATPMWNWNVPSALKAWIDNIIMPGVLAPGDGKWADKKVTFLVSEGGSYTVESGKGGWDYLTGYLVQFSQALGATDIEMIFSEFGLAGIAPGMEGLVDKKAESIAAAREKTIARASQ